MTGKVELLTPLGGKVILDPTDTAVDRTLTLPATGATLLTDSAGILNIGSGQVVKDASGNVGVGISYGLSRLTVAGQSPGGDGAYATGRGSIVLNETNRTSVNETGGLELKTSVFGSGYGAKIMALDNGSLVIGNRDNSATYAERLRITSTGNVGIGTSSPLGKLAVAGNIVANVGDTDGFGFNRAGVYRRALSLDGADDLRLFNEVNNDLLFGTNNTERARIDNSGNLLVGTTSTLSNDGRVSVNAVSGVNAFVGRVPNNNFSNFVGENSAGSLTFFVQGSGQINSTSTSISAISDKTLKENVRVLDTGLSEILALQPRRFDWKENQGTGEKNIAGFIAQEVELVLPDLISDYKINESETKKALKMGDMLPTLVNAIQELSAKVDTLQAELNTLKGN